MKILNEKIFLNLINQVKVDRLFFLFFLFVYPILSYTQDLSKVRFTPPKIEVYENDSILLLDLKEENKKDSVDLSFPYIDDREFSLNFPGGDKALLNYIKTNLQYPDSALKARIEGKVYVSFMINGYGEISEIEIIKGLCPIINNEVVKLISKMPNWVWDDNVTPNERIKLKRIIPISFKLKRK